MEHSGRLLGTVKVPAEAAQAYTEKLKACGVGNVQVRTVKYEQFVEESRMNYDCVFAQMWEEKLPVVYLEFSFDPTDAGRAAAFHTEYNLMQIPLNLRYDFA